MKGLLYRFSIRNRLLLMLILPLFGLLLFAGDGILDRRALSQDMQQVQSLTALSVDVSDLMHQLQLERGMSAGFVGSQGANFATELDRQRSLTDQSLSHLVSSMDTVSGLDSRTSRALTQAISSLGRLDTTRRQVSQLQLSGADTIAFYTDINALLTEAIGRLPRHVGEGEVVSQMSSYANLVQIKEMAGIERALMTNVFSRDQFNADEYGQFIGLVESQQNFQQGFEVMASEAALGAFMDAVQSAAGRESGRLQSLALERGMEGGFEVDSGHWFDQQTAYINSLRDVENMMADAITDVAADLGSTAQTQFIVFLLATLLMVGVVSLLGFAMSRSITDPLGQALEALQDIAEGDGDLTRRLQVESQDEVGRLSEAFNRFADKIETMIVQVRESVATIHGAAEEISSGNYDLSQRTEEQATSLEETAASMEEMTATVQETAKNARQADELAVRARDRAERGGDVVSQAVAAMAEINQASTRIADITSVIEEIAFQTNLLALNAAVEAARAGEQGRGFAVVAGEVRSLAHKSSDAAKQVRMLIEDSSEKVEHGSKMVNESGDTLNEIVNEVKSVTTIVAEIATASEEQSSGIQQVNTAVTQMDDVTQQNAALVEEASASASAMKEQAKALNELVRQFKVRSIEHHASNASQKAGAGANQVVTGMPSTESGVDTQAHDQRMHQMQPAAKAAVNG